MIIKTAIMNNGIRHILLAISHISLLVIMLIAPSSTYSQRISWDTVLCEGLKGFESNGKWGFKDSTGMVIIKPRFDAVLWFSEGLCPVKIKDKWGFINKNGTVVIQPKYGSARTFCNGYSVVVTNNLWGVINKKGEETAPLKFKYRISNFFGDTAMTQIDTSYYYINPKGEIIGDIQFDNENKIIKHQR